MTSRWPGFQSPLGPGMEALLAHKWALGCRFRSVESTLRLLDQFLVEQHVETIEAITPGVIDTFLASRPRAAPRSYNHLLGIVTRLFDWLVARDLVPRSPVHAKPRRTTASRLPFLFDPPAARRLLDVAGALPDTRNTPHRGLSYRTIFALLYGLGLRVGEVARLRIGDIDLPRQWLVVRDTKFTKSRLVPFGPRMGQLVADYLDRRTATPRPGPLIASLPVFSFRKRPAGVAVHHQHHLSRARAPARVAHPRRHRIPVCSLPPTLVCRRHLAAVVPQRHRSGGAVVPALDVYGPRESQVDRGLSDHHHRSPDGGQSPVRALG